MQFPNWFCDALHEVLRLDPLIERKANETTRTYWTAHEAPIKKNLKALEETDKSIIVVVLIVCVGSSLMIGYVVFLVKGLLKRRDERAAANNQHLQSTKLDKATYESDKINQDAHNTTMNDFVRDATKRDQTVEDWMKKHDEDQVKRDEAARIRDEAQQKLNEENAAFQKAQEKRNDGADRRDKTREERHLAQQSRDLMQEVRHNARQNLNETQETENDQNRKLRHDFWDQSARLMQVQGSRPLRQRLPSSFPFPTLTDRPGCAKVADCSNARSVAEPQHDDTGVTAPPPSSSTTPESPSLRSRGDSQRQSSTDENVEIAITTPQASSPQSPSSLDLEACIVHIRTQLENNAAVVDPCITFEEATMLSRALSQARKESSPVTNELITLQQDVVASLHGTQGSLKWRISNLKRQRKEADRSGQVEQAKQMYAALQDLYKCEVTVKEMLMSFGVQPQARSSRQGSVRSVRGGHGGHSG